MTDEVKAKAKILFVDDERQILIALRALFRSQYQVFTATNGMEALDIIRREPIQAIISDQRMPHMLGHELLRQVKALSPNTMRLLLTGYSDLGAIMNSINDGEVFRFIHKPWDNTELRAIVDSAVKIAGDTRTSMAASATASSAATTSTTATDAAGVLIIEETPDIYRKASELYRGKRPVHIADRVDSAIDILNSQEIAVIVTDVTINGEDATDFIKLLKQQYPLTMTIVLTEALDSDVAIELINQGQVFRYLRKPIGAATLQLSIGHGLRFYYTHKDKPELLQRHQVEQNTTVRNPSLLARIGSRLQLLRRRFSFGV